jgi:hypothetical protein
MRPIDLEYYRQSFDWLSADFGAFLVTSAIACLVDENHRSGVTMATDFDSHDEVFELSWQSTIDELQRRSLPNDKELTQKGAECISLLLAKELLGYEEFETARIGTRVDFWLIPSDAAGGFNIQAGLEVSGIRRETKNNLVKTRINGKTKQVEKSPDLDVPVYISIVEFSCPKSSFRSQA